MEKTKQQCSLYSNGVWFELTNINELTTDVTLQITVKNENLKKLSLIDKIKSIFTPVDNTIAFTLDRTQSKNLSSFVYGELSAADKAFKESKTLQSSETKAEPKPIKTRKPRKKVTNANQGEDTTSQK